MRNLLILTFVSFEPTLLKKRTLALATHAARLNLGTDDEPADVYQFLVPAPVAHPSMCTMSTRSAGRNRSKGVRFEERGHGRDRKQGQPSSCRSPSMSPVDRTVW